MELQKANCVYNSVFWALLIMMSALTMTSGIGPVINFYVLAPLTFAFSIVTTFCLLPPQPSPEEEERVEEGNNEEQPMIGEVEHPAQTRSKQRIVWIDQLKVLLICLVVVGHSAVSIMGFGAFLSLGSFDEQEQQEDIAPSITTSTFYYDAVFWSGFLLLKPTIVPLFFFVSGYFSAAGREKHGRNAFLRKSFYRLGPVAIVFWLLVNPLNSYFGFALVKPENMAFAYSPGQAATWFLTWLMVFNSCYALIDDDEFTTHVDKPAFGRIIKLGLVLAIIQGVAGALCLFSGGSFAEMPCLLVGDGYFNVLGYASGILAKTHGWLKNEPDPDNESLVKKAKVYVMVVGTITIFFCFFCFAPGAPLATTVGESPAGFLFVSLIMCLPLGPYCPCAWIVWLDFFQQRQVPPESGDSVTEERSEHQTSCSNKFLSQAAFAVFLIHYFFITINTYLYIKILEHTTEIIISFIESTTTAKFEPALTDEQKFLGFLFVASSSLIGSFLVGALLKKIPWIGRFL